MSKRTYIIESVRQFIRTHRLKPGDALPSERDFARRLGVSYSLVRMANDILAREGLVERRHGQGTFVAELASESASSGSTRKRRLGLLRVDIPPIPSSYSQDLAFAIQDRAGQLGYELIIEQMRSEDLMMGHVPEMIRRRSVDAVILDGRVTQAHLRFLERHAILYVVTGTLPLGPEVPQVRVNIYDLSRQITRELLEAGYGPIWIDADANDQSYFVGCERLRGHMDEIQQSSLGDGALHLCPITIERVEEVVDRLGASDLSGAACIVENLAWPLVAETLAIRYPQAGQPLFVPLPVDHVVARGARCRRLHWRYATSRDWIARPTVENLVGVLEGEQAYFQSISIDMPCSFDWTHDPPEADLSYAEVPFGPRFTAEFHSGGAIWRAQTNGARGREAPPPTAPMEREHLTSHSTVA